MFISKFYGKKLWTNHERKSAQSRAFRESREYILPARFDDTEIPGLLSTVGYVDLRQKSPEQFAALIIQKVGPRPVEEKLSQEAPEIVANPQSVRQRPMRARTDEITPSAAGSSKEEFDLVHFNRLLEFAFNPGGLNLSKPQARQWAEANLALSIRDFDRFKELAEYAFSPSGLNKSHQQAKEWAEANFSFFEVNDFSRFMELAAYAFSPNGLNMTHEQAEEWAMNKILGQKPSQL